MHKISKIMHSPSDSVPVSSCSFLHAASNSSTVTQVIKEHALCVTEIAYVHKYTGGIDVKL